MWTAGQHVGEFEVICHLGKGGLGDSYLVQHSEAGTSHVIKVFSETVAASSGFDQRLRILGARLTLLDHPNVVSLQDVGELEGKPFIRMEYVEPVEHGGYACSSLLHHLYARGGRLPEPLFLKYLEGIVAGLSYLHDKDLRHLNLKPSNILIGPDGPKIMDAALPGIAGEDLFLELASAADAHAEDQGQVALAESYQYMSPEQRKGKDLNEQSDLYSLGMIVFRTITGEEEFSFSDPLSRGLPHNWEVLVRNCIKPIREERFPNASALKPLVQRVAERAAGKPAAGRRAPLSSLSMDNQAVGPVSTYHSSTPAGTATTLLPPGAAPKPRQGKAIVAKAIMVFVALLMVGGFVFLKRHPELLPFFEEPVVEEVVEEVVIDPEQVARAEVLKTEVEMMLAEADLDNIDDANNAVLFKREILDHQIYIDLAEERDDWNTVVKRYEMMRKAIRRVVQIDQERNSARDAEARAKVVLTRLHSSEVRDYDPETWAEENKHYMEAVTLLEKGKFVQAEAMWAEVTSKLESMEKNARFMDPYAENQTLYHHEVNKQKQLLTVRGGKAWARMQERAAVARGLPPEYRDGNEAYVGLRKELAELIQAVQLEDDEKFFNEHFTAAKSALEKKAWRDVFFGLGMALRKQVEARPEAQALYDQHSESHAPGTKKEIVVGALKIKMIWIPSTQSAAWRESHEDQDYFQMGTTKLVVKDVMIPMGFWMAQYEVSQKEWAGVMGENASHFHDNLERPVDSISWNGCQAFISKLNEMYEGEGAFRLPSDAEWEFACRAGSDTVFSSGDTPEDLARVGWYWGNARGESHPVGTKDPNAWGLYDMHGNLWEWCDDYWASLNANPGNGAPFFSRHNQRQRVVRGGAWISKAPKCASTYRRKVDADASESGLGFRLVLSR